MRDQRSADADALRALGKALQGQLDPEALEDLKEFGGSGDPKAARRLAEAMGKALSKLSEAERQRLAEQLKKQLEQSPGGAVAPMTREELANCLIYQIGPALPVVADALSAESIRIRSHASIVGVLT